jgi:restriction endonuclease S subunit
MKAGWVTKPLGDVCKIVNGSTPLRSNKTYWDNGEINWFTIDDIREQGRIIRSTKQKVSQIALEETSLRVLPPKSILLCCTASIGEFAISETSLATNQQFNGLIVNDDKTLNSFFLFHFCGTLKEKLSKISGKTTIDFIPISRLRNLEIPIPPIAEQQRIVSILDRAFEGIDIATANAKKNLANAREIFDSEMHAILSKRGDGWIDKTLDQVCIVERGSSPRPIKEFFTSAQDGVNWVKIGDTEEGGKYVYSTAQKITPEGAKQSRFVKQGDFILTNSMSYGRPYIMKTTGCIHDGWFVLRLNVGIDSDYFYYLLSSHFVQSQFSNLASGSVVKNISGDLVKKAVLPIPPLDHQHVIVTKLMQLSDEIKRLETIYQQKLVALEKLKKSILNQAFTGQLN